NDEIRNDAAQNGTARCRQSGASTQVANLMTSPFPREAVSAASKCSGLVGCALWMTAFCTTPVHAESTASLVSPSGTTAVVTMTVTVTTSLGTSSDSDTKTIGIFASSAARVPEQSPPWSAITLDSLLIDPADATFHFDLYCFPFVGCQPLDVSLTNLFLQSTGPLSSVLSPTGQANFPAASMILTGNYATTGIATSSGTISSVVTPNFSQRVSALAGHIMKFDQCSMSPVTTVVDPASLPAGVTALTVTLNANLATVTLSGPWIALNPYDLTGDGLVGAADLSLLLSQWGGKGQADFDRTGVVDAADLSAMLANWS
ncbi:MAG: hypothetical protein ACKO3W_10580, partial [bacterium]